MPPVDPETPESKTDEKPTFQSYFELLEAKYGDESEKPARSRRSPEKKRPSNEPASGPGGGRRKEGRQWLGTLLVLLLVAAGFIGLAQWMPEDWFLFSGTDSATSTTEEPATGATSEEPGAGPTTSPGDSAIDGAPAPATAQTARGLGAEGPAAGGGVARRDDTASIADAEAQNSAADLARLGAADEGGAPTGGSGEGLDSGDGDRDPVNTGDSPSLAQERGANIPIADSTSSDSGPSSGAVEGSPSEQTILAQAPENQAADSGAGDSPSASPTPPNPARSTAAADPRPAESPGTNPGAELPQAAVSQPPVTSDESVASSSPGAVLQRPRKVFAPQPAYPELARQRGEKGTVTVRGKVSAAGDVFDASVVESVSPALDRAALEAFRTWQFLPAKRNGVAVESAYRVAFNFQIDSDPPPTSAEGEGASGSSASAPAEPVSGPAAPLPYGGDYSPPERRITPLPTYPQEARASGASGDVVLDIVVETDGSVSQIEVIRSLSSALDGAALDAVRRWRFRPATKDDTPVRVHHRVTLRFAP